MNESKKRNACEIWTIVLTAILAALSTLTGLFKGNNNQDE